MDPISSMALAVVFTAAMFYVLYNVIRKAVASGIRDARESDNQGGHRCSSDETQ